MHLLSAAAAASGREVGFGDDGDDEAVEEVREGGRHDRGGARDVVAEPRAMVYLHELELLLAGVLSRGRSDLREKQIQRGPRGGSVGQLTLFGCTALFR